jgi:spore germination protein GerM
MSGRGRRVRRRRMVVGLVMVLLLAAACSAPVDSGPKTIRSASIPLGLRETSSTTTTTVPTGESEEVTVYFFFPDLRLQPVKRRVSSPVTVEKVLQKLFAGPTPAEAVTGLRTAISYDTTIQGAAVKNRIVTVDTSKQFAFGPLPERITAFAQVVFTALDVNEVTGVLFAVNGRRLDAPDGFGLPQSVPLGRAAYPQATPR